MTQERRKDEARPTEQLVFTDAVLIAAALAHLKAESSAACLLALPDQPLYIAVGTKGAMRGLLSDDPITDTEQLAGQQWRAPAAPASAAAASLLMDGAIDAMWFEAFGFPCGGGRRTSAHNFARAIERATLGASPSPKLPEGGEADEDVLTDKRIGQLYLSTRNIGHATNREIAFARAIEQEVQRRCRESRHEIIEEAARRVEDRAANIGPVEIIGEACHETAANVILNVAAAVRALKLNQSGERRCRAQRTNNEVSRDEVLEEAARILDGVNSHDNPMTAGDCADAIRALKGTTTPAPAPAGGDAQAQDAARWRFMMRIADDEAGPEFQAMESVGNDEFEEGRQKSVQLEEMADQAMEIVRKSSPVSSGVVGEVKS